MAQEVKNNKEVSKQEVPINMQKPQVAEQKKKEVIEEKPAPPKPEVKSNMEKTKKRRSPWSSFIFIFVVDLICLGLMFFVLNLVSSKAAELKKFRNATLAADQKSKAEVADLQNKNITDKADSLKAIFPKDEGLVNFVKSLEDIKGQGGALQNFSFASDVAVRDKTGLYGIPFLLELSGSWSEIDESLMQVEKLPYLLRAVTINAKLDETNPDIIIFKFGGLIYVDESLGKSQ